MVSNSALQPSCAFCGVSITDVNDSREHVIPNSIGGRLKTRGFVCIACNSDKGDAWDSALAQQLNPLCHLFGIVRERGAPPPHTFKTTAGETLTRHSDGSFSPARPTYKEEPGASGVQIQIVARTRQEVRKMLEGVKRKYPQVDIAPLLERATITSTYPKGMVHFGISFGGEVAGRSVVKTALAFAHHNGIPAEACDLAISYLRDSSVSACFGYYYERDLLQGRPEGIPLHCVTVSGDPSSGLLLGYVEYFGVQRIVACLSQSYGGSVVRSTHAIDPTSGKELGVSVDLSFSAADIAAIYDYKKFPDGAVQQAFAQVVPPALKRQFESEKDRVIREAVEYGFANCGAKPGEMLTQEHVQKLGSLVAAKMTPFILHNIRRRRS